MTAYPSIYQANAVKVTPTSVTAFVPQVFGDVPVEVTEFTGSIPSAPGRGWIFFQAGNSDFPVWSSTVGGGSGGGGADEVFVGPDDPGTSFELWYDTDATPSGGGGGGGGTNEVWVGTDDPIVANPTIELWYDTDALAMLTDDTRWNTAWGIVGIADVSAYQGATYANGTWAPGAGPITFTALSGRRYRFVLHIRAWAPTTGTLAVLRIGIYDGVTSGPPNNNLFDDYINGTIAWDSCTRTAAFTGDGAVHTFRVALTGSGQSVTVYTTEFYVEDIGPVSSAIPAVNPIPAWLPLQPLLQNGWVDYASPYGPAFYRKVGDIVSLRGLVQSGSSPTAVVCTLPSGYRPPYEMIMTAACYQGHAEIRISTSGTVTASAAFPAATAGPQTWLTLSDVAFSVSP